jgi:hypothetical protein
MGAAAGQPSELLRTGMGFGGEGGWKGDVAEACTRGDGMLMTEAVSSG